MSTDVVVETLTAADAEVGQRRAAGALRGAGLRAGDRVAFCLPSSAALLCAVLGALRTGVVPVLVNATLLAAERDQLLDDADPALVVTDTDALGALGTGPEAPLAPFPLARPMHYTSGTTGRSKGVWSGPWDPATAREALGDESAQWSLGPDDVHLVCSPMYHSVSVRLAGGTLMAGGTCVILGRFDAGTAHQLLTDRHPAAGQAAPTTTFMAPTALARLLEVDTDARFDHLRLLVHAGSPCPPAVKREAMRRTAPGVVWEFYGSTEGQFTACGPEEWTARPGTVGRARPGRVVTVADDGTVWCRPPAFGRFTYWSDRAKTDAAWAGGAFTVGDLGRLDDDGYLYLDGRRDDLIISGGVNVYPAEVEAVLGAVEGVVEVAVFGLPDRRWGQQVCAAVVPDGRLAPARAAELIEAVAAHATTHLAGYKRPKRYTAIDSLPRTATGKVQRNRLPAQLGWEILCP